jgi:hypothetical protein
MVADTSSTDASVAFALTTSPGATDGSSTRAVSVAPSGHAASTPHAARPALPLSSASPQQIRQAIRDALRDLHDDSKEAIDDDLLEVLGRRLASRN